MSLSNIGEISFGENSQESLTNEVEYSEGIETLLNIIDSELESMLENEEYSEPISQMDEMSLERQEMVRETLSQEEELVSLSDKGNEKNSLPRIQVTMNGRETLALVDTDASVNFVRPDLLQGIELTNLPQPKKIYIGLCRRVKPELGPGKAKSRNIKPRVRNRVHGGVEPE
ncbi:hypothetical protein JTB14_019595 [Gonioctena quinquepunctata]|nr:hypothetical protein JTB14_019595 [Gonioctena quinquepunctata]